jgi:hypothetical protein
VVYPPDKFGDKNPRKLEVYLPMIPELKPTTFFSWPDDEYKKSNIYFEYNQQKLKKLTLERQNKTLDNSPDNPLVMFFKCIGDDNMDFKGRVASKSKKNFQLTDEYDDSKVYLQYGRMTDSKFSMDVAYPFSLFQAFAICLSTFDYKR